MDIMQYIPYLEIQTYLLFLIGIMISSGIIKEKGLFTDVFTLIFKKVKSKRLVLFLVSFLGGLLPIPGRVAISAGILDTIAPLDPKSRSKFGVIDYLSTHTYYLWSPLEKTVILPMATLGITYASFIGYVWPLLLVTFLYVYYWVFIKVKEEDIELVMVDEPFKPLRFILGALPLFIAIFFVAIGFQGYVVFTITAAYYAMAVEDLDPKKIRGYVNWNLIFLLAIVLILSVFVGQHLPQIESYISNNAYLDITTTSGFLTISSFAFMASWILGSSGKYAGIVALLLTVYGPQYLVWFLALEFAAYNLSPTHKCVHIGRMYFGTTIKDYFKALIIWQILLLSIAYLL